MAVGQDGAPPAWHDDGGLAVVRIKPLGAGGGGIERSAAVAEPGAGAVRCDERGVCVAGPGAVGGRERLFTYPRHVFGPEREQQQLFDEFMPQRIGAFLQGVDANIVAYGQTGCGKTHTMFGPPGIMAEAAAGTYGADVCPCYGLFPRGLLQILAELRRLRQDRGPGALRYELTVSAVELTASEGNLDLFHKARRSNVRGAFAPFSGAQGVSCDRTCKPARLYGMTQLPLDGDDEAALRTVFGAIACRNTQGTGLNDTSSRSHCFVFLNLYALDPATQSVRTSRFQFVDLAGSERMRDAHGGANWATNAGAMEGMMTNYSLMMLSQRVRELVAARKRGKSQKDLVNQSFRTQCDPELLPLLGGTLTGLALTLLVVCVSAAPDNAAQSINTLSFGETFGRLGVWPKERHFVPLQELRAAAEELAAKDKGDAPVDASAGCGAAQGRNMKYALIRAAQGRDGRQKLGTLARLQGGLTPALTAKPTAAPSAAPPAASPATSPAVPAASPAVPPEAPPSCAEVPPS